MDPFQNAKDDDSEDEGEKEDNEQKPGQATEQPPNESQETRDFEGETTEDRLVFSAEVLKRHILTRNKARQWL